MSAGLRPVLPGVIVGLLIVIAVSPASGDHLDYAVDDNSPDWNPDGKTLRGINAPCIIDGLPYDLCYAGLGSLLNENAVIAAAPT
jgi:hypothetical protein